MTDQQQEKNSIHARRKILRTLVAGGGAITAAQATPDEWVKPMVQSVVLPAHAQTSEVVVGGSPVGQFNSGSLMASLESGQETLADLEPLGEELLEFFLPSANAGGCFPNSSCDVQFGMEVYSGPTGAICVTGDTVGSTGLNFISPTQIGFSGKLGDYSVVGGQFNGSSWTVDVVRPGSPSNISQSVTLSNGVSPCKIPI